MELKKEALEIGEETVKAVIQKIVMPYAKDYIEKSPNQIDNILLPFLESIEASLLGLAEQINPED